MILSGFQPTFILRIQFRLIFRFFIFHPPYHNNNVFISFIKYTNITPPANSKANRGRWRVDGLRFITILAKCSQSYKSCVRTVRTHAHTIILNSPRETRLSLLTRYLALYAMHKSRWRSENRPIFSRLSGERWQVRGGPGERDIRTTWDKYNSWLLVFSSKAD